MKANVKILAILLVGVIAEGHVLEIAKIPVLMVAKADVEILVVKDV